MDPRHPEQAIDRIDQLIVQFKSVLDKIRTNTVSSRIGQLEREGGLVVQEICLVAPRLHEAMIQASRKRRHDLSHGVVKNPVMVKLERPLTEEEGKKIVESISTDKVDESVEKPKKKTTRKKKTAKKAEK